MAEILHALLKYGRLKTHVNLIKFWFLVPLIMKYLITVMFINFVRLWICQYMDIFKIFVWCGQFISADSNYWKPKRISKPINLVFCTIISLTEKMKTRWVRFLKQQVFKLWIYLQYVSLAPFIYFLIFIHIICGLLTWKSDLVSF